MTTRSLHNVRLTLTLVQICCHVHFIQYINRGKTKGSTCVVCEMEGKKLSADLLHAHTHIQCYALSFIGPLSLKCAVELGIPTIIHNHGRPISLPELTAALHIPATKSSYLHRLMRLLTHSNYFHATPIDDNEAVYSLTSLSRLLVNDNTTAAGLSPLVLTLLDPVTLNPFHSMGAWFKGDMETPFKEVHGCGLWEKADQDRHFNERFNAGTASDSNFLADILVKECAHVLEGVKSLVDVGGGTGSAARTISEAFPDVKCSVLELAHVIEALPKDGIVEFIAGDMFDCIPAADAILLKWVLHDWSHEDCVKILKRCKEALPSKNDGGKVIIIDLVLGYKNSHPKTTETELYMDMLMLVTVPGEEREEHKWKKMFIDAGFTDYKITPSLGLRSVIEVYP